MSQGGFTPSSLNQAEAWHERLEECSDDSTHAPTIIDHQNLSPMPAGQRTKIAARNAGAP
jgi:hypothetical protein